MNDLEKLKKLEGFIKEKVPSFRIKFKNESLFMKLLGCLLFFAKGFMTSYITTIGTTVYFPDRKIYNDDPFRAFRGVAHEGVHVFDYVKSPFWFVVKYLFPQALAVLSIFSIFAIWYTPFLFFLLFLLCLAPVPALGRKQLEVRGYGMSIKVEAWRDTIYPEMISNMVGNFTGSTYYFMYPFKKEITEELSYWIENDDCLNDSNPMYKEVYSIINS